MTVSPWRPTCPWPGPAGAGGEDRAARVTWGRRSRGEEESRALRRGLGSPPKLTPVWCASQGWRATCGRGLGRGRERGCLNCPLAWPLEAAAHRDGGDAMSSRYSAEESEQSWRTRPLIGPGPVCSFMGGIASY